MVLGGYFAFTPTKRNCQKVFWGVLFGKMESKNAVKPRITKSQKQKEKSPVFGKAENGKRRMFFWGKVLPVKGGIGLCGRRILKASV